MLDLAAAMLEGCEYAGKKIAARESRGLAPDSQSGLAVWLKNLAWRHPEAMSMLLSKMPHQRVYHSFEEIATHLRELILKEHHDDIRLERQAAKRGRGGGADGARRELERRHQAQHFNAARRQSALLERRRVGRDPHDALRCGRAISIRSGDMT
jgi:hypothetical protein